ncbi:hypothetical protein BH11PSE2_BH11PSE2_16160 [soil metagenome]
MKLILAVALSVTLAAPVLAAETPQQAQPTAASDAAKTPEPAKTADKPEKEKVICRKEQKTGSAMATRICMTASEWEDEARAAKEFGNRRPTR